MVSDMAIKGVLFRWVGQPIKAPSVSVGHPHGGRLRHYGTVEIVEVENEAEMEDAVSISLDDIVEVLALDGGKENSGTLGNEGNDSSPHQPFLAQVEALWEDIFTGIPYCRARWLLRASDLPGDISGNEVLLTTAADTFGITYILGLAQIGSPAVLGVEQPHPESDCEAMRSCRADTPKGDGKGRGKATLRLTRGYDPFSEGRQFMCLPDDHPALSRLRHRAQVGAAAVSDGNGDARGVSEHSQHKRRSSRRSGWRFSVRELGADVRDGVERKSLRSVRLAEGGERKARDERKVSIQHSSDISSSDASDESYREKDDASSPDSDGQLKKEPRAGKAVRCHHPMVRRKRQTRESSIASDVQQHRPKRLAMPPSHPSSKAIPTTRSSSIDGVNSSKSIRLVEPVSVNSERSKSSLLGGQVARDIQVKGESEGEERPPRGAFPHRPASVGREYQADIPALLSAEEQKAYREEVDKGEKGGEQVWASVRNWKDEDKSRLEEYLQEARCSMEERRFAPGVPVAISIGNSKDKRRKKKMAWAVMSTKVSDSKKASVKCSGNESLEVSRHTIQSFQVEEMALHAWMQERNVDDFGPALRALHSQTHDSGPLATWTNEQIGSLLEALERDFGQDRYHRSRGQDRHRDEHTNLASLSISVAGKTPSQVLSFYYRYMATGDPISYLLGSSESSRKLREKRIIRPRTPPSPSASPSPTLKQQQQQQHVSDRDTNTVAANIKETDVASEGVKMESGCRERAAVPTGNTSEQLRSSLGSGREAYPGEAMGAGVLESLPQRGTLDEGESGMQRPRYMRGTLRSAIPADAIIVEVSDDEESSIQSRSHQTGNDNEVKVGNDGVGERGVGRAVSFSEPASGGFAVHGPGYEGRTTEKGSDSFDSFHHPCPVDPAYMGARYPDQGYSGRRYADPQYHDQRYVDQRQYPDPQYNAESRSSDQQLVDPQYSNSRNFDPVYAGPRYAGQRYPDPRYERDTRYSADQGVTGDPRLAADHVMHSVDHGNPLGGVHSLENGLYPIQTVDRGDIGRGGVGYGRVARMHSSEGIVQGHGRGRCVDGGIEMAHCWQLLEWAKRSGLEEDRVQYLEGLLQVHERRPMTYNMLVERLESALSDRPSILDNFIRLFAQMEVPDPRHPYSAPRSHAPIDYNNIDKVQSVNPRSNSGRDIRFPPRSSRGPYHDSAMEEFPYDPRGMERRSGQGQHGVFITDRRSPPPILGSPRAVDVSVDIPMRGSSTPAMLLLPPPPPLPEAYPGSLPYTTRDFSLSGAARGMASAYHSGEVVSASKVSTELASGVGDDASMMPRSYRRHGYREGDIGSSVLAAPDAAAGGSKPSPVVGGVGSIARVDFGRNGDSDAKEAYRSHHDRVDMLRPS